jgi:hypothetical protein
MIPLLGIVAVVLGIVIIYFIFKIRSTIKKAPGADSKMNTIELIRNWQEQKSKENEYQNQLRQKAQEQAKPEIEKILVNKYKNEEIAKMTADPKDKFKNNLKSGLGIDSDKMFSDERIDRITGKGNTAGSNLGGNVGSSDHLFTSSRIDRMTGRGVDDNKIRGATQSESLNWNKGVRAGLNSEAKFSGVDRALGRDTIKDTRRKQPPYRP